MKLEVLVFSLLLAICAASETLLLKVLNQAGQSIEFFWVDSFSAGSDGQHRVVPTIRPKTETLINTYAGHKFIVQFAKHIPGTECEFVKGDSDETIVVYFDEISNRITLKASPTVNELEATIQSASEECGNPKSENYTSCVAASILPYLDKITSSTNKLKKYRDAISGRLRNYTCEDESLPTSTPLSTHTYFLNDGSNRSYNVNMYLDMVHAKIWSIEQFVTDEECDILVKHGRPRLRRATVAAEDGSSVVSENRKANQASYTDHSVSEQDPLWDLQQRILDITNHHAKLQLAPPGQEGFTIIQYNPSDQYTPHCDGNCDNSPHIPTGRVATAVMYCIVPEVGGATTFTKADVFVRPKRGAATFFSYKGTDGRMDHGYTEHSGCPVIQGEKWITTFWMREGVSYEHPSTRYDPGGIEILGEE